jgi:hypothetical protein
LTKENFNPWTEREGKTDVTLKTRYNTTGISAKNWSDFDFFSKKENKSKYKGFNTPNFIYSMIRTLQIDNTIEWGRDLRNYYTNKVAFSENKLEKYH